MVHEWTQRHLCDVADVIISNVDKKTKDDESPVRLCNYTDVYYNQFIRRGMEFMSATAKDREIAKCALSKGDVVITKDSEVSDDIGVPAYIRDDIEGLVCGYHLVILRPRTTVIDGAFLFYALNASDAQVQFHAKANGITRFGLRKNDIETINVPIPPLHVQHRIADILGSLDDKIDLNRQMNQTLEATARALFKSWFIDFDPVRRSPRAKAPDPIADLFPRQLQDSPLGPIPKGWKVERFGDHLCADRGLSYKGSGLRDDGSGLPMHNLNSIYEGGGYKHEGIKYYAGEYREKHLLHPGDLIVTNTEQGFDHLLIGYSAIVPPRFGPRGLFSHHIYRVRPKPSSPLTPHYLTHLFNNPRWHYWISGFSNGTTINMLPLDALEMPLLVVPPAELVRRFTSLVIAVHEQVEVNISESNDLAATRDALLPKLMSAQLPMAIEHTLAEAP